MSCARQEETQRAKPDPQVADGGGGRGGHAGARAAKKGTIGIGREEKLAEGEPGEQKKGTRPEKDTRGERQAGFLGEDK